MKISCCGCGTWIDIVEKVGFRETCPSCDAWLHSCVHCCFWSGNHCTEPAAEKPGDPQAQNFCEWYKERAQGTSTVAKATADRGRGAQEGEGRASAEELWKKLTKK